MRKVFAYYDEKQRLAVETILIFIVPIVLLKWGVIPLSFRMVMLVCITLCVIAIIVREKWSMHDLGFRRITRRALFVYATATGVALLCLWLYSLSLPLPNIDTKDFFQHLLLTFIPVSFFQELLYRGFLMHMLEKVYTDKLTILLYNATLFALLHIIYPFPFAVFPLVFLGGIFFATLYVEERNLFLITLCHAVLNFAALTMGFFVIS